MGRVQYVPGNAALLYPAKPISAYDLAACVYVVYSLGIYNGGTNVKGKTESAVCFAIGTWFFYPVYAMVPLSGDKDSPCCTRTMQ